MSEKIQLARRGFLGNLLKGAAATAVASTALAPAAKAEIIKAPEEVSDFAKFAKENWPSWDSLIQKLRDKPQLNWPHTGVFVLTPDEHAVIGQYMLRSRNITKVFMTYSLLQRSQRDLVKVHPIVSNRIVGLAVDKPGWRAGCVNLPDFMVPERNHNGLSDGNKADMRDLI